MKKILAIDDSETNLLLIQSVFKEDEVFDVKLLNDSKKAMETIKEYDPDILLLDLMMPNIDGFQILNEIKAIPELHHVRVLVISAKDDRASVKTAMESGAVDYLIKPIDLKELETKVKQLFVNI